MCADKDAEVERPEIGIGTVLNRFVLCMQHGYKKQQMNVDKQKSFHVMITNDLSFYCLLHYLS